MNNLFTRAIAGRGARGVALPIVLALIASLAGGFILAGKAPVNVTAFALAGSTTTSGTSDLIANGGVESGLSPWQKTSTGGNGVVSSARAHSGGNSMALCGYNSCNDQVWQVVTLPTSFTKLTLSYWEYSTTQEASTYCYDAFHSRIRSSTGVLLATVRSACNSNSSGWTQTTVDLTSTLGPYKGKQVEVYFQGTTNTLRPSTFYVDDVSLTATTSTSVAAPTATAQPAATARPTATSTPAAASAPTATASASGCPGSQSACVTAMLNIINTERSQAGLPAYTLNSSQSNGTSTCVGSYGHSTAMAQSGSIWHTNSAYPNASFPKDICISYSTAGENVGYASYGNELTDLQTINSQMMSEAHDATTCATSVNHACNILSSSFHQIGIGIYNANGVTWLTEDFTN
jgi:uncharacterized protein YkwD